MFLTTLQILCFWSLSTTEKNIWLFSNEMLHYVHQLITNFVCLQFGAAQQAYSRCIEPFCWKQLEIRSTQNSKSEGSKTKTMSWKTLKISVQLSRAAELGDISVWFHHYEQPFHIQPDIWSIVNIKILIVAALIIHHYAPCTYILACFVSMP